MSKIFNIEGLLFLQVWIFLTATHDVTAVSHLNEEGKPFTFTAQWDPPADTFMEVALLREGTIHAIFSTDLVSYNYFEHRASSDIHKTDGAVLAINYTLFETTRDEEGEWVLQYIEGFDQHLPPIHSFHLRVFTKILNFDCEESTKENTVCISCKTNKVYPKAQCLFQVNVKNDDSIIQNPWSREVKYSHHTSLDDYTFFISQCDLELPVTDLRQDVIISVQVVMYPNITGSLDDVIHGHNATVRLDLNDFMKITTTTSEAVNTSRQTRQIITSATESLLWPAPPKSISSDQEEDSQHILYLVVYLIVFLAITFILVISVINCKSSTVCRCRNYSSHIYVEVEY